uniref:Uncharacterized protein AlNc14C46G3711 n=1 Tax=Albugo laibachii Nc14 TaxID=890382 RepID=F0WAI6_9STRA|nr:conserved hypothetical protein [Albugo laibachii Nc14]|eukprot:CCA18157.1 conserved hypothetical protein [Albugo laibachii Nc14]
MKILHVYIYNLDRICGYQGDKFKMVPQQRKFMADFHMHSTCSDGKLRPSHVIREAAGNGVTYMSLTDHDTMAGTNEALQTAQQLGVFAFPGVEISAEVISENLHILGYFPPGFESEQLETQLSKIRVARYARGKKMLEKLAHMGIKIEWKQVLEVAGEAAPGRPHIAQVMVNCGFVRTFREAFDRYLHNDGPAYAQGQHYPPEQAIKLIKSIGGISILAHPWACKDPMTVVRQVAKQGIDGIEVFHSISTVEKYSAIADELGLLKSGGTDFHAYNTKNDNGPGAVLFSRANVEAFLAHAKSVWEPQLRETLNKIKIKLRSGVESSVSLLIWKKLEECARAAIKSLDLTVSVSDSGHYHAIIRRRLLTRTSAIGKSGIKRCADSMITYLHTIADEHADATKSKIELDGALWEIEQAELEASKTKIFGQTCKKELQAYGDLHTTIDASIDRVSKEIIQLKCAVRKEKTLRMYKEEYETLAKLVNQYPSQKETLREVERKKARLVEAKQALQSVDRKLENRVKQFSLLLTTIQDLKCTLDEEVDEVIEENQDVSSNESGTEKTEEKIIGMVQAC